MRTVTAEEVQESAAWIADASKSEIEQFMAQMGEEQPYVQVYVAAICDREFENENDADAFVNLAGIVLHAMREAAGGPLSEISGDDLEEHEDRMMAFFEYAEGESESQWPETLGAWLNDYAQRPLLEFVLDAIISPESDFDISPIASGPMFSHLKVIMDSLDGADRTR